MTRKMILLSMPFNIGVGGFKRSYFVLPHISRELYNEGFEVELYIPANAIRTALKFYIQETCRETATDYKDCHEKALNRVIETLQTLEKESHYAFHINEKALSILLLLNAKLITSEQSNSKRGNSIGRYIIERNREFLMSIFERIAWEQVRQYYNNKISFVYSHHETADALAVTSSLSKYANGVVLLMQSNIKGLTAKSILSNIKSKLLGVLAVSPQPIVESPFIATMARSLKVLIPALALDPLIYAVDKSKSQVEQYSAVYFGRLNREKGLVDLLRAWSIISQKEPRARLTLIGIPENHEILATINKYIAKYRNVRYSGYLPPEKLYREVVRHHVLIYPSYRDSFSLTVLEALALGLGVVAYDIPVIRFMYSRSSKVYIVKKGDAILLAEGVIYRFYRDAEPDEYTKALIKLHSSWEKVAAAEAQAILSFCTHGMNQSAFNI